MAEKPALSLSAVLQDTVWHVQGDATLVGTYFMGGDRATFTTEDIALLHPGLLAALHAQLRWVTAAAAQGKQPLIFGDAIARQLQHLTSAPLLLADAVASDTRHYTAELRGLSRAATPGMFVLSALSYAVTTANHVDFVVPHTQTTRDYPVTMDWLEARFPGWLPRFEVAEFLGLSGKDLVAHVFTKEPVKHAARVDMDGVTFD